MNIFPIILLLDILTASVTIPTTGGAPTSYQFLGGLKPSEHTEFASVTTWTDTDGRRAFQVPGYDPSKHLFVIARASNAEGQSGDSNEVLSPAALGLIYHPNGQEWRAHWCACQMTADQLWWNNFHEVFPYPHIPECD